MEKRFGEWIQVKEKLHTTPRRVPHVSERDIWWFSVGENVGSEINGKNKIFTRPGIIYKKLSHDQYLIIPTSTKQKLGTWYVPFCHKGTSTVACLHQVRAIDYRRLFSKLGELDDRDWESIKEGFWNLYK